jgi:hypothetical protein
MVVDCTQCNRSHVGGQKSTVHIVTHCALGQDWAVYLCRLQCTASIWQSPSWTWYTVLHPNLLHITGDNFHATSTHCYTSLRFTR